jgi:nucleoside phosphorylase
MSNPDNYTIGWICALHEELVAAQAFLDEEHDPPTQVSRHDANDYTLGKIGQHNVVIAVLPSSEYGTASAASVARDMVHSFPNVRLGLMVGIGGGAPSNKHDIRLGDVVVSNPEGGNGGVFQYDFGKTKQGQGFQTTGVLDQPPRALRTAVNGLKAKYARTGHEFETAINNAFERFPKLRKKYRQPDIGTDRLYQPEIVHPQDNDVTCAEICGDNLAVLVPRSKRTDEDDNPAIHYGIIASANQVMKDAVVRDSIAAANDVLCFEMEAAGLMNNFPCLVIRGICDYADSHKKKEWQGYAAMTAAAYAKDLLRRIVPDSVEAEKKLGEVLFSG